MLEYNIINFLEFILVCILAINLFLFFLFYTQEKFKKLEKEIKDNLEQITQYLKKVSENLYFVINKIGIYKVNLENELGNLKESQILELHNMGLNINEISQKLNISPSEIEFIIKVNDLKKTT